MNYYQLSKKDSAPWSWAIINALEKYSKITVVTQVTAETSPEQGKRSHVKQQVKYPNNNKKKKKKKEVY
jgi:hypothetical protein